MPRICTKVAMPGGGVAIITTSSSISPSDPCGYCILLPPKRHEVLCDFPIRKGKDTKRYTCTRRLCEAHKTTHKIHRVNGDLQIDFCPAHQVLLEDHGLV